MTTTATITSTDLDRASDTEIDKYWSRIERALNTPGGATAPPNNLEALSI